MLIKSKLVREDLSFLSFPTPIGNPFINSVIAKERFWRLRQSRPSSLPFVTSSIEEPAKLRSLLSYVSPQNTRPPSSAPPPPLSSTTPKEQEWRGCPP